MQEMQETRVQSPGQEDSLEKEISTHSSSLAWEIPWKEEPGGLQSVELERVRHDEHTCAGTHTHIHTHTRHPRLWSSLN